MERLQIAEAIREIVDAETSDWGVDIESIKIQELELPAEMKRAMARQAEAERERRATVIASQGELEASKNLRTAAAELAGSPRCPAPADPANHSGYRLRSLRETRSVPPVEYCQCGF